MVILWLAMAGLVAGSFVNALVWRLHAQDKGDKKLSILMGRSLCPQCRHQLAAKDLVPLWSWMRLKGRCRYCRKSISRQYPLVEAAMAAMFVASYILWPFSIEGTEAIRFGCWLGFLTGFIALTIYDLKWLLLPNRIIYPLIALAAGQWLLIWAVDGLTAYQLRDITLSALTGGGLFYLLFQLSGGKWIGGGDVRLGFLLGLIVGDPLQAWLVLFLASFIGTLVILPLMLSGVANRKSRIPFGPFLMAGGVVVVLFGVPIMDWLERVVLLS